MKTIVEGLHLTSFIVTQYHILPRIRGCFTMVHPPGHLDNPRASEGLQGILFIILDHLIHNSKLKLLTIIVL